MPVLVDDDPVLEVTVADPGMVRMLPDAAGRRPERDGGLDRVAVGLGDGDRGDARPAVPVIERGQHRRSGGRVVRDDDRVGPERLREPAPASRYEQATVPPSTITIQSVVGSGAG